MLSPLTDAANLRHLLAPRWRVGPVLATGERWTARVASRNRDEGNRAPLGVRDDVPRSQRRELGTGHIWATWSASLALLSRQRRGGLLEPVRYLPSATSHGGSQSASSGWGSSATALCGRTSWSSPSIPFASLRWLSTELPNAGNLPRESKRTTVRVRTGQMEIWPELAVCRALLTCVCLRVALWGGITCGSTTLPPRTESVVGIAGSGAVVTQAD